MMDSNIISLLILNKDLRGNILTELIITNLESGHSLYTLKKVRT